MRLSTALVFLSTVGTAVSQTLYAAVADGTVQKLILSESKLTSSQTVKACGANPSWLTFTNTTLYCSGEATPGTLTTFVYQASGTTNDTLFQHSSIETIGGDVSSAIYGSGKFIALAHYGQNKISAYSLPISSTSKPLVVITPNFTGPGPNPRQDKGYPHQVIIDPSGKFLFSPDLGADLVRVYGINETSGSLMLGAELKLDPGSGPRHVAFYRKINASATDPTYFYVANELSNTVVSFRMTTNSTSTVFHQMGLPLLARPNNTMLKDVSLAEIRVQGTTLTVSNRGAATYGPGADSLSVWDINSNGTLSNQRLFPSGGDFPRSFQFNKAGTRVAVGNQRSKAVVILERFVNGTIGNVVAMAALSGEVIDVVWAEDEGPFLGKDLSALNSLDQTLASLGSKSIL